MVFVYFASSSSSRYLTFVCIYAIAGAACNTDKEAQQLIAPIQMVMMLPWFMMFAHHHQSRLDARRRLLDDAGLRSDRRCSSGRSSPSRRCGTSLVSIAVSIVDDRALLLGHGEDLPRRHPLVRKAADDSGAVAVDEGGVSGGRGRRCERS